jgi:hypothetical protein
MKNTDCMNCKPPDIPCYVCYKHPEKAAARDRKRREKEEEQRKLNPKNKTITHRFDLR